jgi:hypothetical protein
VIDGNGSVTINDGRLSLCKQSGEVVAEGPMNEVWAVVYRLSLGVTTLVSIGGERYFIRPPKNPARPLDDAGNIQAGMKLRKAFLEVAESEGGHIGKPDR